MNVKRISIAAILTAGSLLGHTLCAKSQINDVAIAHIKYGFVHVDDTNHREEPHKEEMMLYIGKQSSMFKSFSAAAKIAEMKKNFEENIEDLDLPAGAVTSQSSMVQFAGYGISGHTLYLFPQISKCTVSDRIGTADYLLPQSYPEIEWQITATTKEIGGYLCQRAVGTFGGRTYTAWFTTELPFPFGPWKLHGLPGLILEAKDATGDVSFTYAGFDKEAGMPVPIQLPENATETTEKTFVKAQKAFMANPADNMLRSMNIPAGAQVSTTIVYKDASGKNISPEEAKAMMAKGKEGKSKRVNNPLERDGTSH